MAMLIVIAVVGLYIWTLGEEEMTTRSRSLQTPLRTRPRDIL